MPDRPGAVAIQLDLFSRPVGYSSNGFIAPALRDGRTRAFMCSWCGSHLEVVDYATKPPLGACPACGCTTWWSASIRGYDLVPVTHQSAKGG